MLFIDLAVPRNIDPGVGDLNGAVLRSVDDLAPLAQAGNDKRREAAARAAAETRPSRRHAPIPFRITNEVVSGEAPGLFVTGNDKNDSHASP